MPKCDFNKVATPFPRNTSGWLLLDVLKKLYEHFCGRVSFLIKLIFIEK